MNIYLAIILYIISVVAGILAFVAGKKISPRNFLFGALLHVLFIILFVYTALSSDKSAEQPPILKLSFLFTICSGLILSGVAWKSGIPVVVKIYFSLFALTLLLFLFSPSRMTNFLLTSRYADTMGKTFSVGENYFLEEQTSFMNGDSNIPHYKLVRKHGMYYETIQRDIVFGGNLDSISVLEFTISQHALIRGYTGKITYVSTEVDSVDVPIRLVKENKEHIERKL
jgi:hypothetical protein